MRDSDRTGGADAEHEPGGSTGVAHDHGDTHGGGSAFGTDDHRRAADGGADGADGADERDDPNDYDGDGHGQDHSDHDGDGHGQDHSDQDGDGHGQDHSDHDDNGHEQDHHDHDDHEHDHHHHDVSELGVAVLTVSSSRSLDDDPAGDAIVDIVDDAGHEITVRELVRDEYDGVQDAVDRFVDRDDTDVVVSSGGTGVTPDDVTVQAVEPLFDKHLPGFGELFRRFSYDDVGTKVVGTRAVAGVVDDTPVFCLPGSENATRLGTRDIIVEEAPHLAGLAGREE